MRGSWLRAGAVLAIGVSIAAASQVFAEEADPWSDVEEMLVIGSGSALVTTEVQSSSIGFSEETLKAMRIADVRDVAAFTPNLEIKSGGGASNATFFIRGIGLNDFNANASSSVAIVNDGVHINSPAGQLFGLFDVAGLEVLRGPQGTLYGRNVTAGAILVQSNKPGDEVADRFTVSYGAYDLVEVENALTVPVVPDLVSVRLAGRFQVRDGITKNRCATSPRQGQQGLGDCVRQVSFSNPPLPPDIPDGLAKWVNDVDKWAARAIVQITPNESTTFLLNVHGGQSRGDSRQNQARGTRTNISLPPRFGENGAGWIDRDDDPFEGAYDIVANEYLDLFGASLTARIAFDRFEVTSVTAYEQNDRAFLSNGDASPSYLIVADVKDLARQWSEDLRIESTDERRLSWKFGALFTTEQLRVNNYYQTTPGLQSPTRQFLKQQFFHVAGFGFVSFELSESFKIEGGVRAAWERKEIENLSFRQSLRNGRRFPDPPFSATAQDEWTPITGDLILTWAPTESVDFYAKYVRGWKTGHFNGGASRPDILVDPVEPESVNGFEVGAHGSFFDERLTLDAAVYFYDYKDYQVFAIQNQPDALPLAQLINAQDVESRGFEIDLRTVPVDGVRWNASIGWIEAKFGTFTTSSFRTGQGVVQCEGANFCLLPDSDDFTGNRLPAAPSLTFSTSLEADIPLWNAGTLVPRIDANYKSKVYFDHQGDDALAQAPFWLIDTRLTYRDASETISLSFWVKNLFDEAYLLNTTDLRDGFDTILDVFGDPRTFGGTLELKF